MASSRTSSSRNSKRLGNLRSGENRARQGLELANKLSFSTSDRPLAVHLPEGTRERHLDSRVRIIVILAAPGVVLDVPCGFQRDRAVGPLRRDADRLVQPGV